VRSASPRTEWGARVFSRLSSATTLPGALIVYFALSASSGIIAYVPVISAASFVHIAAADLNPGFQHEA
jgi:zinc and cadmium transporter